MERVGGSASAALEYPRASATTASTESENRRSIVCLPRRQGEPRGMAGSLFETAGGRWTRRTPAASAPPRARLADPAGSQALCRGGKLLEHGLHQREPVGDARLGSNVGGQDEELRSSLLGHQRRDRLVV